jgi:hypothetical protein
MLPRSRLQPCPTHGDADCTLYPDALKTSYTGSVGTTINFTDPLNGSAIPVHFDSYEETVRDLHSQIISLATGGSAGASYEVRVVLVEA